MQILLTLGVIVTEVCCNKINMNTKEKDIIKRILNGGELSGPKKIKVFFFFQK